MCLIPMNAVRKVLVYGKVTTNASFQAASTDHHHPLPRPIHRLPLMNIASPYHAFQESSTRYRNLGREAPSAPVPTHPPHGAVPPAQQGSSFTAQSGYFPFPAQYPPHEPHQRVILPPLRFMSDTQPRTTSHPPHTTSHPVHRPPVFPAEQPHSQNWQYSAPSFSGRRP